MSECICGGTTPHRLIYACSGASNTGYLADCAARKMMRDGTGKMTCLAAIGAELSGFIESAKAAESNIVIDGCRVSCGKKTFEKLGLPFIHCKTTDFGVEKGKTEITEDIVNKVSREITEAVTDGGR